MTVERWADSQRDVPVPGCSNPCGDAMKVMLLPGRAGSMLALWHSSSCIVPPVTGTSTICSSKHISPCYADAAQRPQPLPKAQCQVPEQPGLSQTPAHSYQGWAALPEALHPARESHGQVPNLPGVRGKSWQGSRQHPTKGQSPPQRRVRSC